MVTPFETLLMPMILQPLQRIPSVQAVDDLRQRQHQGHQPAKSLLLHKDAPLLIPFAAQS